MEFFGSFDEFLRIGSVTITMYAFCILMGALIAGYVSIKEARKLALDTNKILDGILFGLPIGIVGARLYYVIFEWDKYYVKGDIFGTLGNAFAITEGGLAITGGIIAAVIFVIVWCKLKKINILNVMDLLAPGMLIAQACGRWGNFFNQEAHGGVIKNVDFMYKILPDFIMDKMQIGGQYYHPTFLYESLWNLVGVAIIMVARRKFKQIQIGDFIGFYLIWYGIGRATLIEPFRTDALMWGDIRVNILIPALFAIGGIIYLIVKHICFPQKTYVGQIEENTVVTEDGTVVTKTEETKESVPFTQMIRMKIRKFLELDEETDNSVYLKNMRKTEDDTETTEQEDENQETDGKIE
ncbi:MAG: prolipoprotein diacylglyceryl transferase [bacterium]